MCELSPPPTSAIYASSRMSGQTNVLQNVKQSGCDLVIGMMLPTSGLFRDDSGTYKISATQKSEFVKYLKTTFSPHIRRLNAHNLRYQKQDRFWIGWFQIWQLKLTAQPVNCAKCFLKVSARLVTVLLNDWCEIEEHPVYSCKILTYNTVHCVCGEEFDSFCCRFTTMSRVIEHGGCRIASPAWAVRALPRLDSGAPETAELTRGTSAILAGDG